MTVAICLFGYKAENLSFEHRVQIELLIRTIFIGRKMKKGLERRRARQEAVAKALGIAVPKLPSQQRREAEASNVIKLPVRHRRPPG